MRKRAIRIGLRIGAIIAVVLIGLLGAAVWRLSSGPISLSFLVPYIEKELASAVDGYSFDLKGIGIAWGGWSKGFNLQAEDVDLRHQDGSLFTSVHLIEVDLSARALMKGQIGLLSVSVISPELALRRDRQGQIVLDLGESSGTPRQSDGGANQFLTSFAGKPSGEGPAGYLEDVRLVKGSVTIHDDRSGLDWTVSDIDLKLAREVAGLELDGGFQVILQNEPTSVQVSGNYLLASKAITLKAKLGNLSLPKLAAEFDELDFLKQLQFSIAGDISVAMTPSGQVENLKFDLISNPGKIVEADLYPNGLAIKSIQAAGRLDADFDQLSVDEFLVDFDGPTINIIGDLTGIKTAPVINADLAVNKVDVDDIKQLWPTTAAPSARDWLTKNVSAGEVHNIEASISTHSKSADFNNLSLDKLEGSAAFADIVVNFLPSMPPLSGISGNAKFETDKLEVDITTARVDKINLSRGHVEILGVATPSEEIKADVEVAGPLRSIAELLNHEPFRYGEKFGIDPAGATGQATARATFSLPIGKTIELADMTYSAQVTLSDIGWHKVYRSLSVEKGNFKVDADNHRKTAHGSLSIGGHPISIKWTDVVSEHSSELKISGSIDEKLFATLGADPAPYMTGSLKLDLVYKMGRDDKSVLKGSFDLADASVNVAVLPLVKAKGVPGRADFELQVVDGKPAEISSVVINAAGLNASGSARFADHGESIESVLLNKLNLGLTELKGSVKLDQDGTFRIKISGHGVDISHLLADTGSADAAKNSAESREQVEKAKTGKKDTKGVDHKDPPFDFVVEAELGRLFVDSAKDRFFKNISLTAERRKGIIQSGRLQLDLPTSEVPLTASIEKQGDRRNLLAQTADLGDLLEILGYYGKLKGGTLKVVGYFDDKKPDRPLNLKVTIKDFHLVNEPMLAQILTLTSFTGIIDEFTNQGIEVSILESEIEVAGDTYEVRKFMAHGPAVGVTVEGKYDSSAEIVDVNGTVVPAYFLNSLLGDIPLLGKLFTGGQGEGLLAVSYAAKGKPSSPHVSVDPITSVLPGGLRDIFRDAVANSTKDPIKPYGDD